MKKIECTDFPLKGRGSLRPPGVYQPTPPLNFVILAGWGELTPFARSRDGQFRSAPTFLVNSFKYTKDYKEVKEVGFLQSTTRTARQSETATFWYDVATKEWHGAAQAGLSHVSANEWRAARLLALVSIAMADGVIASFDTKFNDNFWRPITAIRAGNNDGNSSTKGDPTWEPFCVTPPFPEHNSTHAVTAAAAATRLASRMPSSFSSRIRAVTGARARRVTGRRTTSG